MHTCIVVLHRNQCQACTFKSQMHLNMQTLKRKVPQRSILEWTAMMHKYCLICEWLLVMQIWGCMAKSTFKTLVESKQLQHQGYSFATTYCMVVTADHTKHLTKFPSRKWGMGTVSSRHRLYVRKCSCAQANTCTKFAYSWDQDIHCLAMHSKVQHSDTNKQQHLATQKYLCTT